MAAAFFFFCLVIAAGLRVGGGGEAVGTGKISMADLFIGEGAKPSLVVAQDGSGDATTIQAAFDLVPAHNQQRFKILVKPGTYREKVTLDYTKTFVSLIGTDRTSTTITWNQTAGDAGGTLNSATMSIKAMFFCACNITFENTAPSPRPGESNKQAVALLLAGEKSVLYQCNVLGYQDTLFDNQGIHFIYKSHIRGTIDFIFGSGQSLYKECTLESVAETDGAVTASQRSRSDESGFVFVGCELKGSGQISLGRTYGPFARVVYGSCYFGDVVRPQGWSLMMQNDSTSDVFFVEFNCTGPGSNLSQRVPWMRTLSEEEMKPFLG